MSKPWTLAVIMVNPSDRKLVDKMGPPEANGKPVPVVNDPTVKRGTLKMIGTDWTEAEVEITALS